MRASIVDKIAVIVGVFFVGGCIPKIVPLQPYHDMMVDTFKFWAHVCPLVELGFPMPNAAFYRTLCGVAELCFGSLLAFGKPFVRRGSALILMSISVISVYSMVVLGSTVEVIPAILLALLLFVCVFHGFKETTQQIKPKKE
ncbi:uncharacterized protein [Antedon mediterranea]|uniref:uncharacterized protein n=1 Tax=Antedon mediterranea TaxID=105859 RepID=UPI003AF861FB